MDLSGITLTVIATTSFVLSGLCSLAKSAQVNFSSTKMEAMFESEKKLKNFHKFLNKASHAIIGLTILGTLANIAFVLAILLFFSDKGRISDLNLFFGIVLSLCPLLIFAKAIPETLARLQPERIMLWAIPFSMAVYIGLFWLIWPVYRLTRASEKFLGKTNYIALASVIRKEIMQVVSEGQREGVLHEVTKRMIQGIMELKVCQVSEIMTPRPDMFCIAFDTNLPETISTAMEKGHSRIPVFQENRDNIVGILYLKDILKYWADEKRKSLTLEHLMRTPYFVPETKQIGALLQEMQKQKLHIAIVLDEYGGTAGIVTIEDIIEEIVGEIADEYDSETIAPISKISDTVAELDARVHVEEVNEVLQSQIPPDEDYETLGGFLFSYLGYIPKKNEKCRYENLEFLILEASERCLGRVKITKLEPKTVDNKE